MFNWGKKKTVKPVECDEETYRERSLRDFRADAEQTAIARAQACERGNVVHQVRMLESEIGAWVQLVVTNWRVRGEYEDALHALLRLQEVALELSQLPGGRIVEGESINSLHLLLIAAGKAELIPQIFPTFATVYPWDVVDGVLIANILGKPVPAAATEKAKSLLAGRGEIARTYRSYFELLEREKPTEGREAILVRAESNWENRARSTAEYPGPNFGIGQAVVKVEIDLRLAAVLSQLDFGGDSPHAWPWGRAQRAADLRAEATKV
ncbi:hypothetical protein [Maricaulis sp.]|uniref:hypothetical protein n=1 Tax=Maricaulis sp. TaxID=1486257 RepID=UPI001B26FEEA|nr:hypothetical protein [Maricaulis sp.]MBO6797005.1 hypothetical protein [Maricaulis sp.]